MPNENETPTIETTTLPQGENQEHSGANQTGPANEGQGSVTDAEIAAKEQKKANLDKAIAEAEEELRKKRQAAKQQAENKEDEDEEEEEEETPQSMNVQIDFNDPAAKAWDKHIRKNVSPIAQEREAEKAEIRKFAIKEFLADKPAIARDPEKIKELMEMYQRVATNTGLTKEGVTADLSRAFGALYHEQLVEAAKTQKFDRVKEMELFSDPGVDKGATGYVNEERKMPNLSPDDLKVLNSWGLTPEQWWEMQKNQSSE